MDTVTPEEPVVLSPRSQAVSAFQHLTVEDVNGSSDEEEKAEEDSHQTVSEPARHQATPSEETPEAAEQRGSNAAAAAASSEVEWRPVPAVSKAQTSADEGAALEMAGEDYSERHSGEPAAKAADVKESDRGAAACLCDESCKVLRMQCVGSSCTTTCFNSTASFCLCLCAHVCASVLWSCSLTAFHDDCLPNKPSLVSLCLQASCSIVRNFWHFSKGFPKIVMVSRTI